MGELFRQQPHGELGPHAPVHVFDDPVAMQSFGSRIFGPYRLEVPRASRRFDARLSHVPAGALSFNTVAYDNDVAVDPGCVHDFYLMQMVLAGEEVLRYGDAEFRLLPGAVSVISPDVPLRKLSAAGTRKLLVRIDRALMERSCTQHLGYDLKKELRFDVVQPDGGAGDGALKRLIAFLLGQLSGAGELFRSPLMLASIEQMVANSLLLSHRHNYSAELVDPELAAMPGFVRCVERYIEENAHRPIAIGELARHAGVSVRSLFAGFQRYRHASPMQKLRHVRLRRAREELLAGDGSLLVADVAARWGFAHPSRFAHQYKRHFGETPSETLKRAV